MYLSYCNLKQSFCLVNSSPILQIQSKQNRYAVICMHCIFLTSIIRNGINQMNVNLRKQYETQQKSETDVLNNITLICELNHLFLSEAYLN